MQDLLADGKTPHERRFVGESFKRMNIPFGALVEHLPNSERDKARNSSIWKEDILIADIGGLESWMHQKYVLED